MLDRTFDKWDQLCLAMDTYQNSLVDLSMEENDATRVGTPTFTASQGFSNLTLLNYIESGFNINAATHFSWDSNCMFCYNRTDPTTGGVGKLMGIKDGADLPYVIYTLGNGNHFHYDSNISPTTKASTAGFIGNGRDGTNQLHTYSDDSFASTSITESNLELAQDIWIGCANDAGSSDDPPGITTEIAGWGIGDISNLATTGFVLFRNAVQQYLADLGTAV